MKIGADIGYNATKVKGGGVQKQFPSVVGTPERASFSLNGARDILITEPDGSMWLVGESAVAQSRFASRREDRGWIESGEYYRLFLTALTEASRGSADVTVVTGLPVNYYQDKERLQEILLGQHRVKRDDRKWQTFNVSEVRVIPQPFGAVLAVALDGNGRIVNNDVAQGNIGIIDIGGKTTNFLSVDRLSEISKETASVNLGAWDVVRQVRDYLSQEYPDLELRDHEIAEVIKQRWFSYFGGVVDVTAVIDDVLQPISEQIVAQATQLWNSGARLGTILVAGGGAYLVGGHILDYFPHAAIVDNPEFANVEGFYRFAQRL